MSLQKLCSKAAYFVQILAVRMRSIWNKEILSCDRYVFYEFLFVYIVYILFISEQPDSPRWSASFKKRDDGYKHSAVKTFAVFVFIEWISKLNVIKTIP